MKLVLGVLLTAVCSSFCLGQKTIADLNLSHARTVQRFLSNNRSYDFMSENKLGSKYVKSVREWLEGNRPYYAVGDFNRDQVKDFAVILSKKGKVQKGGGSAFPHDLDYPLAVVIFNGQRDGGFRRPFIEHVKKPIASFIRPSDGGRKGLLFGVFETDDDWIFTPNGQSYKIKYIGG